MKRRADPYPPPPPLWSTVVVVFSVLTAGGLVGYLADLNGAVTFAVELVIALVAWAVVGLLWRWLNTAR